MKWNPIINALGATLYITAVAVVLNTIESVRSDTPDTIIDGIGFLSLFVLSVAVMAFLFFYQPLIKLIDRKPKEALHYFLATVSIFGVTTFTILTLIGMQ